MNGMVAWKPLGIILSVVWFLAAMGVVYTNAYERYNRLHETRFNDCRAAYGYPAFGPGTLDFCEAQTRHSIGDFPATSTILKSVAFAAITTALLWLLFATVWFPFRWIFAKRHNDL